MINIAICICTRKRQEGLNKLLNSLENLRTPPETNFGIIIVENDTENFSEALIKDFSSRCKFKISYFVETRQGIVYARNRSVAEAGNYDFCCFTDDDQVVTPDWLMELIKCQKEFDADGVAGPTKPYFTKEVPLYIEKFHQPNTYQYGTIVESAFTGCLLIRKKYLDLLDGPFDTRLNFSGGEDSFMTMKISELGGVIRFNPNAIAYEIILDARTTIKYIIKRKYRTSNTELLIKSLTIINFTKIRVLSRLVIRFFYGLLIILPFFFFSKTDGLKGLLKIVNAVGGFAFIFGKQSQFYK